MHTNYHNYVIADVNCSCVQMYVCIQMYVIADVIEEKL